MADMKFEQLLVQTVKAYRARAKNCDKLHSLSLTIVAEGRLDGDLNISYQFAQGYEGSVTGNTMDDVFKEFLRRKGWDETHKPLCLPNVEDGDLHNDNAEAF